MARTSGLLSAASIAAAMPAQTYSLMALRRSGRSMVISSAWPRMALRTTSVTVFSPKK
jgi:hypothetical protein